MAVLQALVEGWLFGSHIKGNRLRCTAASAYTFPTMSENHVDLGKVIHTLAGSYEPQLWVSASL